MRKKRMHEESGMNLIKLSDQTVLKNKKIICIEKSKEYLTELCEKYDILDDIVMVLDDNPRNLGVLRFSDKEIPVCGLEFLNQYTLHDTVLLITSDYYKEYADKLKKILRLNHVMENVYFFANKETEYELLYREKYACRPLENIIVFRSGPHANAYVKGMDFSDNAKALFEYALSIGVNKKYKLVWIVKSPNEFSEYMQYENVYFLPFEGAFSEDAVIRERYYRVLCLAKYFFFTDAYGFVRNCRRDQIRVQLWHGCGYKKRLSVIACEKRYDYMTVTSSLYARLHANEFGLKDEQMLVTGCAKTDWLFHPFPDVLNICGIPPARKYIFWLPTYRFSEQSRDKPIDGNLNKETGLPLISSLYELKMIDQILIKYGIVLVVKLHPFQDQKSLHIKDTSNIVLLNNEILAKNDLHINQVLGVADALISDYSSTAVDFLLLDRPMAFLLEDAGVYSKIRGLIFENIEEWLPGKLVFHKTDLVDFIKEIGTDQDTVKSKRTELLKKMHRYRDANSCKRILQTLKIIEE